MKNTKSHDRPYYVDGEAGIMSKAEVDELMLLDGWLFDIIVNDQGIHYSRIVDLIEQGIEIPITRFTVSQWTKSVSTKHSTFISLFALFATNDRIPLNFPYWDYAYFIFQTFLEYMANIQPCSVLDHKELWSKICRKNKLVLFTAISAASEQQLTVQFTHAEQFPYVDVCGESVADKLISRLLCQE